jgi:hypothetical protein
VTNRALVFVQVNLTVWNKLATEQTVDLPSMVARGPVVLAVKGVRATDFNGTFKRKTKATHLTRKQQLSIESNNHQTKATTVKQKQ